MLYAHTPNAAGDWHELEKHLLDVANMAAMFAEPFGAADLARLVGLWHDLGKCNPRFQEYLLACNQVKLEGRPPPLKGVPHAIWGAAYAYELLRLKMGSDRWHYLAMPIQAHHSQLPDRGTGGSQVIGDFLETNSDSCRQMAELFASLRKGMAGWSPKVTLPELSRLDQDLFTRMLFSALIDADRLDTEEHFDSQKSELRSKRKPSLLELNAALTSFLEGFKNTGTTLNQVQQEVRRACIDAAASSPGMYRLTVPTGGGKTLSGMAFALAHALHNGNALKRVIVALPFTSIIEQNAQVYRDIPGFGDAAVLEHHSAVELPVDEKEKQDEKGLRAQLAAENWDMPVVVTTTVQLFESLFSNRPSKVRKLHRLAKSVIILDEIQAFPPKLLLPTLDVLKTLAKPVDQGGYGATVVLCTATQPSFDSELFASLLEGIDIQEIVPNYPEHFAKLQRVSYEWRPRAVSWTDLATDLRDLEQFLVVLNTKKDALSLFDELDDGLAPLFHLSTLLCTAHRRVVLDEVKSRLKVGDRVRLVSTQVVECGVDFDFPVVYRAIGPLDRIVQAAGRCNRRGKPDKGRVVIFNPAEGAAPSGPYKIGIGIAEFLMQEHDAHELHNPTLYEEYFRRLFDDLGRDLDQKRIQVFREALNFPEVAENYRLISKDTVPVVVKFGEHWHKYLDEFRKSPSRRSWQQVQPYVVNLYRHELRRYAEWTEEIGENLYLWHGRYESRRGLVAPSADAPFADPSDLVV